MQPIAEVNRMGPDEFAAALKPLFEAAAPLASALYGARPFASYADLLERAETIATRLPLAEQIEIINAHPRIGESPEVLRQTAPLSYAEQGYAAEGDRPSAELTSIHARLAELNREYDARFGFRFVVFVDGRSKAELLEVLRTRLQNPRDTEREAALQAMFLIARDRYSRSQ